MLEYKSITNSATVKYKFELIEHVVRIQKPYKNVVFS